MSTPDILLSILMSLIVIGVGAIFAEQRAQRRENKVQGEISVRIETKLDALPIAEMKADIQSNRHKIAALDKGLVQVGEKISNMEKRCEHLHRDD